MSGFEMTRRGFGVLSLGAVAACVPRRIPRSNVVEPEVQGVTDVMTGELNFRPEYGPLQDAGYNLPPIQERYTQGINRRMTGLYTGEAEPGSIDVDPYAKFLYHVKFDGTAVRYPVGVGRQGRTLSGRAVIQLKKAWPGWTPTRNMLRREPEIYGPFAGGIPGGLRSPLGARALYIYRNGRDTFYRVHGTNDLESIGNSGSAGCIRMFNQDIIHLYNQIETPMPINIRSLEESMRVDPEYFDRGIELPPRAIPAEELLGPEAVANDRAPDLTQLAEDF